jgi:hypothetical protein
MNTATEAPKPTSRNVNGWPRRDPPGLRARSRGRPWHGILEAQIRPSRSGPRPPHRRRPGSATRSSGRMSLPREPLRVGHFEERTAEEHGGRDRGENEAEPREDECRRQDPPKLSAGNDRAICTASRGAEPPQARERSRSDGRCDKAGAQRGDEGMPDPPAPAVEGRGRARPRSESPSRASQQARPH